MRAKVHFEDIDKKASARPSSWMKSLPGEQKTLQERMAELVHEKRLEGISHIQDDRTSPACAW